MAQSIKVIKFGFFDRELCSKVLKEALLLFFFLLEAWNHEQKILQKGQKMFAMKIEQIEQKVAISK